MALHTTDPGHRDPQVHCRNSPTHFCSNKARSSPVFCRHGSDTRHRRKLLGVLFSSRSREEFEHTGSITQAQKHEGEKTLSEVLKAQNKTQSATAPPVNQSTGVPRPAARSVSTQCGAAPRRGTLVRWDTGSEIAAAARPLTPGYNSYTII